MTKKIHQPSAPKGTVEGDQRLLVRGDRRKEPDWDAFIAALIAYALREVEDEARESEVSKESGG